MQIEPKILLVDDDHFYRQLITAMFSSKSYDFCSKPKFFGPSELTLIPSFDLIILDYHLDPQNGIQLAEFIWQFYRQPKILIVTSDKAENVEKEAVGVHNIAKIIDKQQGPYHLLSMVDNVVKSVKNPALTWQLNTRR